jgi:hypothetical protein
MVTLEHSVYNRIVDEIIRWNQVLLRNAYELHYDAISSTIEA